MNPSGDVVKKIEKRAYEIFTSRGGQHGYAMEDWLRAEREVMGKTASAKKSAPPTKSNGRGLFRKR